MGGQGDSLFCGRARAKVEGKCTLPIISGMFRACGPQSEGVLQLGESAGQTVAQRLHWAVSLGGAATAHPASTGPPRKDTAMEVTAAARRPGRAQRRVKPAKRVLLALASLTSETGTFLLEMEGPQRPPHLSRELHNASVTGDPASESACTHSHRAAAPAFPSAISRPLLPSCHLPLRSSSAGSGSVNRTCPPRTEH